MFSTYSYNFDLIYNNVSLVNNLSLYVFNDYFFLNYLNFKNVVLSEKTNNFFLLLQNTNNFIYYLYDFNFLENKQLYNYLLLDYYNYINNVFCLCFNFSNQLNLEQIFNTYYLNNFYINNFSYKLLNIQFFKYSLLNYNSWFLMLLFFFFFFFLVSIVYILFFNKVNNFNKNEKNYDNYNTTINYLIESEKELGSLDDMFVGVSILICIYGWFFFGTFYFNLFNTNILYIFAGFPLFLFIVLGMPTNMIANYGIMYSIYLRGASNTTLLFLEFMYDILATTIMYIRLIVQNVRFILMFFAFFECYEFFVNFIFVNKNYYYLTLNNNFLTVFYQFFVNFLNFTIFFVYNIGHLMYTIISHFFAYLILVFWFFSFLYTTFLDEKLELFFKNKRK